MKDNKSLGVDGIPPKLLKEIVEQISTPLAKLFNLSLEGIVPSKWKEANMRPRHRRLKLLRSLSYFVYVVHALLLYVHSG